MSIPANITAEWSALQTQITANTPLLSASRATRTAIKLNAGQLVADVQAALVAPNNILDTWAAPADPGQIIAGVQTIVTAAEDQSALCLMRGFVGRAASNLDQIP